MLFHIPNSHNEWFQLTTGEHRGRREPHHHHYPPRGHRWHPGGSHKTFCPLDQWPMVRNF